MCMIVEFMWFSFNWMTRRVVVIFGTVAGEGI